MIKANTKLVFKLPGCSKFPGFSKFSTDFLCYRLKMRKVEEGTILPFTGIKLFRNCLDQPENNDIRTFKSIQKISTAQEDDYTTRCLLGHPYFKENYKLIAMGLSKQQALDADPRVIHEINFAENLERTGNTIPFFIIQEVKETILDFSQRTVKVL